jgi:endonuclease/exonuclease/phosphatase family metal-dependent hydrolase
MPVINSANTSYKGRRMKIFLSALVLITSISASALTIGAYNIRNFDYDERSKISTNKAELSTIIKNLKVDVLSVEEINNTSEWDKFVQTKLPGYDTEVSRCGGAHGQRLGFLYKKDSVELLSFNEDLAITEPGTQGSCNTGSRPLAIGLFKIKSTGQKFYGMTAHLKSGSGGVALRSKQFEIIKKIIRELKTKTGVQDFYLAGDLNTTEYLNRGSDYNMLTKFVKDLGMIDLASNLKCSAYYWGGTDDGIETPSLLDHVIVTTGLVTLKTGTSATAHGHCKKVSCREVPVKELGISYESVSDHCPVTATIQK